MHSPLLSQIRARAEYSSRWLLVPLVPVAVVLAVWFVTHEPLAVDDATPAFVESLDPTPAAIAAHGA